MRSQVALFIKIECVDFVNLGAEFAYGIVMKVPLLLCLSTICATSLISVPVARAQNAVEPIRLVLRHVKPSLMAYWVDKAHHKLPEGVSPAEAAIRAKVAYNILDRGLPASVERIDIDEDKNQLIVYGTPEGAAIVADVVGVFDRPLAPLSFEEQRIQVSSSSLNSLGIAFTEATPSPQAPLRVGQVNGPKVRAALTTLIVQDKAKVLSASRPTTMEELTADLQKAGTKSATVGMQGEDGAFMPFFVAGAEGQSPLKVESSQKLSMVPTLNEDKSVSLVISLEQTMQLQGKEALPPTLAGSSAQSVKATVKAGAGEVIVLVLPSGTKTAVPTSTVVFLTPRVVNAVAAITPAA
ncbi:MAG: hypothetical protein EOO38_06165 [Cytophagaceae bacterium]|nr:MAG: hypothetical protein EOO38_06165 [Cytophagaceae bacterium]